MTGDWRDFRPAIWMAMLGIAVAVLVSPWYTSALFFGGAIGFAVAVRRRRIRAARASERGSGRRKT